MNEEQLQEEFPQEKKKKTSDPKLSILMLQLTACLILAAAAVCIRFFGGSLYGEVREKYITMFEDTTTVQEVMNLMKADTSSAPAETGSGGVDQPTVTSDESVSSVAPDVSDTQSEVSSTQEAVSSDTVSGNSTDTSSAEPANAQVVSANAALPTAFTPLAVKTDLAETYQSLYLPTAGTVSSEYGWRADPFSGEDDLHAGIDIAAETGTPVYAALNGTVAEVSDAGGYGIHVVLRHAGGMKTLYAHLSAASCQVGQTIRRGDVIGEVGSTGRSTGPHLHFEVQTTSGTVDPRYLLPTVSLS